ncbi:MULTISPECIES: hypothetical protein [Rhodanobacter]|uniref:hypothetical protein n=1 Tax=Rhodanobacter TaxID=75309 RepID=UPI000A4649E3|nr:MULTISPECIES: hypothetical protein [Rhodanobacter]UJJ49461.1 hypothetical protein LRK52_09350 [Rhodanobacter denitrificans]UJJ58424.1 hypothetical protein LRK55_17595 [Rhodanobacter denitrificans]UJM88852.1 hypothetical protein LRK24_10295 [Rhodanobacter denitrificans]UJM92175.1 hypothetical protein LRK32_09265 [Rhodanobacter denitrificans]UJM95704.1 hypothetical protein LRK44_09270 [Rhodanobacter denitrificans]
MTTLPLFMAQTLNGDASCQATMDRDVVERIANDLSPCSTATGAYCKARQTVRRTPLSAHFPWPQRLSVSEPPAIFCGDMAGWIFESPTALE